ncbi:uncharacterized protein FSUBG_2075 [Fusarium subglutinans]|uniref:Uncharacterized protein n=1 Tax=Gibberella subglutinans TaxID=42677 RepID=A0A8H5QBL9_GIBSU|nr:uncharacterized protein FSUBG_2075 [Fusarium subglutinans]KAF5611638.1 hypothetical protein FSUBG_2075 [Fusarium subglutinans]
MSQWPSRSHKKRGPLLQDDILIEARGQMEANHRAGIYERSVFRPFTPCPYPPNTCPGCNFKDIEDLSVYQAEDCCNKSVPIYIFPRQTPIFPGQTRMHFFLCKVLQNWLYHKWYRLYQSDIEYGQFVAKFFIPCSPPLDGSTTSLVSLINDLNARICSKVASIQDHVQACPVEPRHCYEQTFRDQRFYILQPLFRAMTIILLAEEYDVRMVDIGKMPALLTITGEECGLSQPLSFDSIKNAIDKVISETTVRVRLSVAIEFVQAQQEREVTLFGPQPDPVESTKDMESAPCSMIPYIREFAKQLGWAGEPLQGPSSTWVDPGIHTEWLGDGAKADEWYRGMESDGRWNILLENSGLKHNFRRLQRRNSIS